MQKKISKVKKYLTQKELPSYENLFSLLDEVSIVLENEEVSYRPLNSEGNRGALIELKENIPVIIVPDIHSRPNFILNILDYKLKAENFNFENAEDISLAKALEKGLIYLVCVGDAIHSEVTYSRWGQIEEEFSQDIYDGPFMKEEMIDGLAVLCGIMELKKSFPEHFHFLKGNHENILNISENGDFAFRKYADEGEMVKKFIQSVYGDDILYLISYFENSLPLVAYGRRCVISHAEPALSFTKKELIDAKLNGESVKSLIWTSNDTVFEETALNIMINLLGKRKGKKALYFGGHRPIKNNYSLRQNGKYVQIHNPKKQNITFVSPDRDFDFIYDIVNVELTGGK